MADQDLSEAILDNVRTRNGGACTTAFGENLTATPVPIIKFFFDYAGAAAEPYAVFTEPGEVYEQMTYAVSPSLYVPETITGRIECRVFASDRKQARQLGDDVSAALNDAPIAWPAEETMLFRRMGARFEVIPTTGPGVATVYCRVIVFQYMYSQQMPVSGT